MNRNYLFYIIPFIGSLFFLLLNPTYSCKNSLYSNSLGDNDIKYYLDLNKEANSTQLKINLDSELDIDCWNKIPAELDTTKSGIYKFSFSQENLLKKWYLIDENKINKDVYLRFSENMLFDGAAERKYVIHYDTLRIFGFFDHVCKIEAGIIRSLDESHLTILWYDGEESTYR
jgi:hypothetical protein